MACGKVLCTCPYASTQKTGIFGFPHWIHCSLHSCRFSGAPQSTETPSGIQGRTILLCCPIPTSDILHTQLGEQQTTATDWQPQKNKWIFLFFFFPPLATSKVFLDEGELNNFSQKLFLIYYSLQLDRHTQGQLVLPELSRFTGASTGECLCTPQWHWQRFRLHTAHHSIFISNKELLLTSWSSCLLCLLSGWQWALQKCTSLLCPRLLGSSVPRAHQVTLHPAEVLSCILHPKNTCLPGNPTNGLWINHN